MRIYRDWPMAVVFLCERSTNADTHEPENRPIGTAFVVRIPDEENRAASWIYLVTARHVIEWAEDTDIIIRCNTVNGGEYQDIPVPKREWFSHDHADVAIWRFRGPLSGIGDEGYKLEYKTIPLQIFIGEDYRYRGPINLPDLAIDHSEEIAVELGHELAFLSLFSQHPGKQRILPISRFGHVARLPQETISLPRDKDGETRFEAVAFLAECHSWGGHSGSPVFWAYPIYRSYREGGQRFFAMGNVWGFMGLVSAHFDIPQQAETRGNMSTYGEISTRINAGIAVVTPASQIKELLMRDDVKEERETLKRQAPNRDQLPTMDTASSNSFTEADFEDALRRVSRRVESSESDQASSQT